MTDRPPQKHNKVLWKTVGDWVRKSPTRRKVVSILALPILLILAALESIVEGCLTAKETFVDRFNYTYPLYRDIWKKRRH